MAAFASIFKVWLRYHKGDPPNIEYRRFFANLVPVHATGPKSIPKIIEAHTRRYHQALAIHERVIPEEMTSYNRGPESDTKNYTNKPLYDAIVIVLDDWLGDVFERDEEGRFVNLSKLSGRVNVLLVRTGEESDLSAPIDFGELRCNGHRLPLSRSELKEEDNCAVRVSLATAIKFILDLEKREDAAFPERCLGFPEHSPARDSAERHMKADEGEGYGNGEATRMAIEQIVTGHDLETS